MTLEEFKKTLSEMKPPAEASPALEALWAEANGDWNRAHRIVQESSDRSASWVHAYLHRKEGDTGNAAYWYHRAGREASTLSFNEEWDQIAGQLLASD
jgi:hypothetical protein